MSIERIAALCQQAGVDPDEQITRFTMEDFVAALVSSDWSDTSILRALDRLTPDRLADALCEVSHWGDIFTDTAYFVLDGAVEFESEESE